MRLSVIIPAYNEENYIGACLKSLLNQSERNLEIIVIDDGSTDKTKNIVKEFKNVKLFAGKHNGPGASRNLGAEKATGKILIFVDADMTFDKDYIRNLIEPLQKNEDIVGTTHDYEIATNTDNWIANMWGEIRVSKNDSGNIKIFRAIRKNKFLEMGGFDSRYGYADDQTFWYNFGIKPIAAKDATCYHRNPETLNETFKQARWIGGSWKERFWFFRIPILNLLFLSVYKMIIPIITWKKSSGSSNKKKFYHAKLMGYYFGVKGSIINGKNIK